jgi:hypothetical protein
VITSSSVVGRTRAERRCRFAILQRDVAEKRQNLYLLAHCDALVVVLLPVDVSQGVASRNAPIVVNVTRAVGLRSALCKSRLDS